MEVQILPALYPAFLLALAQAISMAATPPADVPPTRLVSSRWTPYLAKLGWTPVSDFFLDNYHRLEPPLKYAEAMFVIHLMRHKWDQGAPFPSLKSVARKMGISPQSARANARSLEKSKYLFRETQIGGTNKFHLQRLFQALEKLAEKDRKAREAEATKEVTKPKVYNPFKGKSLFGASRPTHHEPPAQRPAPNPITRAAVTSKKKRPTRAK